MSFYISKLVRSIYTDININTIDDYDMWHIVSRVGVPYKYADGFSASLSHGDKSFIFIDKNLTQAQKWQTYCHELGHVMLHAGNQKYIDTYVIDMQECEADLFGYLFCIPDFLLDDLELDPECRIAATQVAEIFGVTDEFAYRRLEMHKNKLLVGV